MRAIDRLISEMSPDDVALVTGSVYLIGEVYPYFLSREGKIGLFPEAGA
jgi:folylpolyglutamate synthase/dihydropteroate synthase